MIGIYLSGTGNTKHCIEKLMGLLDESARAIPIEGKETVNLLEQHDFRHGKKFYKRPFRPLEREDGALRCYNGTI